MCNSPVRFNSVTSSTSQDASLKKITRPIKTIAEILPLWSCSCRKSRALFMFYRYEKQVGRPDAFS